MTPLAVAALSAGDPSAGGPLVDWLAWGATDRELRRWLRDADGPEGPFAPALRDDALPRPDGRTVVAAEVRVEEAQLPNFGDLVLLLIREAVVFENPTESPLDVVRLRVFPAVVDPNLPVRVSGVWSDGAPVPHVLDDSLLLVRLPRPLPPGARARLLLQVVVPVVEFDPALATATGAHGWSPTRGGITGRADDQIALGAFLPTVTSFGVEGQDARPVGFNVVPAVHDPTLWHVAITHPARYTAVGSGVTVGETRDERVVTSFHVAQSRDFAAHLVPDAQVRTVDLGGTRLRAVWADASGEAADIGDELLRIGKEALEAQSAWFGPPAEREIDLVEGPVRGVAGVDFPGLVVVDGRHAQAAWHPSARLEWAVAHGLGHQWWGHEVGTDVVAEPWVQEGLAEHAAGLYWEARYGRQALADRNQVEVLEPAGRMHAHGLQLLPGNMPADAYDAGRFAVMVDGRSAMFFDALRRAYGDEAWRAALADLRRAGSGRRLRGSEVRAILERRAPDGVDVEALFLEDVVSTTFLEDLVSP